MTAENDDLHVWRPGLPTFIGIGPGKSGSSWLYQLLQSHPSVCMSTAKETVFFDDQYYRGLEWYAKFFDRCDHPVVGEVSNTYIFSSDAARRIASFKPDMKLLTILRDPIDRAYSQYLFLLRNGQARGSFRDVASSHPGILKRGRYDVYLDRYLDYFDRSQIHVSSFDDLKRHPERVSERILCFLGVDASEASFDVHERVLPASKARSRTAARLVKRSAGLVRRFGYPELVTLVKSSSLVKMLYKPLPKRKYPPIDPAYRRELCEYFSPSVERLSALVGIDFTGTWLRPETSGAVVARELVAVGGATNADP